MLSPYEKASWPSKLLFNWITPLVKKGSKNELREFDKVASENKSDYLIEELRKNWDNQSGNQSLFKAVVKTFGKKILLNSLLCFLEETLRIAQTLAVIKFMDYFDEKINFQWGMIYGSFIFLSLLICTLVDHVYFWNSAKIGLQIQVALRGLLYQKTFDLHKDDIVKGKLDDVFSNGLSAFEAIIEFLPYFIIAPLQLIFVTCYLYAYVHYTFLAGCLILICFLPIQFLTGKLFEHFQTKFNINTIARIEKLKEMLKNFKVIRFNNYEKYIYDRVKQFRDLETKYLKRIHIISALNTIIEIDLSVYITFVSIAVLVGFTDIQLNPAFIVYSMAFYTRLNGTLGYFLAKAVKNGFTCLQRMRVIEETLRKDKAYENINKELMEENAIEVNGLCSKVFENENRSNFQLQIDRLNFSKGQLVILTGPNNSGKTLLLESLINEVAIEKGDIKIDGKIYYMTQTPWIFTDTFRNNVLFGSRYEENRYKLIIKKCGFNKDLARLENRDLTVVSENDLSGGQKARLSLARAVYSDSDIYLFDEPISAIDNEDSEAIRKNVFKELLAHKTTIVATHRVKNWTFSNRVIFLDDGTITFDSTHEAFVKMNSELKPLNNKDIENQVKSGNRSGVSWNVYKTYLKAGYGLIGSFVLVCFFIGVQFCVVYTDYFVSDWANKESGIDINIDVFNYSILNNSNDYNHSMNIELSKARFIDNRDHYFIRYIIQANAVLILLLTRPLIYYIMCVKAAKRMFNKLLRAILEKEYNFFLRISEGRIMNIFNRDQGVVDDLLASTNFDFLQISSFILVTFGLSVYVNYFVVLPLIILLIFLVWFRTYYIRAGRQLRRLEAEKRDPLLDHLNASTSGISTIRSSNKTEEYKNLLNQKMDAYTMVNFPYITAKRWFALRLDLGIVIFIGFIIFGSVLVKHFLKNFLITPASIGLLLTYCFQLSTQFQFCVRQSCEAECSMISVERIYDYLNTRKYPSEKKHTKRKHASWPQDGTIEFQGVSFRYNSNADYILRNKDFIFKAGQHIGIIGSNGSGKSTLFNLILRLYEMESGQIKIGGEDIKNIDLEEIREKITIIPQDPVVFDASIRENLDPTNRIEKDQENKIKEALRSAGLEGCIDDIDKPDVPKNFSKGQKQLLCFARGILKDTKIYLIDEATSNLSSGVEEKIRQVIHERLEDRTVLIIAHHLETIRKCDMILGVCEKNNFEWGTPSELYENKESLYYRFSVEGKAVSDPSDEDTHESYLDIQVNKQTNIQINNITEIVYENEEEEEINHVELRITAGVGTTQPICGRGRTKKNVNDVQTTQSIKQ
uniref:ATP-binding cassette transporter subfamily C member 4 X5 protein n=1 Tax=Brachionus koreanus TaxID=1199090 RepID=A0A1J0MMS0_9BILA|nr:ATP-binding cassette transporter subfamily C member 4 X5 protein [Brachionus koreanus]